MLAFFIKYIPNILLAVQYGALLARSGMYFMNSQLLVHGAHIQTLLRVAEYRLAVQHDSSYFLLVYNKCDILLR